MNIVIVTDAWMPQINGVVRTLLQIREALQTLGHAVRIVGPARYTAIRCPGYPEIRLSLGAYRIVRRALHRQDYDAVHIATEGPLGIAAQRYCRKHNIAFTTACHTRLVDYLSMRLPMFPNEYAHRWMQRFHAAATITMVRSPSHQRELRELGFRHLQLWPGAVDTALFRPMEKSYWSLPRPIMLYAGRVSKEKNLPAFLALDMPGSKVIVGDGPDRKRLQKRYPNALFTGYKQGTDLVRAMNGADVFVFPSKTDTLGLVMLEANACGVPVAAYPVPGPQDVIRNGCNGALNDDLSTAVFDALRCAPEDCIESASEFSLRRSAERFLLLLSSMGDAPHNDDNTLSQHSTYNPEVWPVAQPTNTSATAATSTHPVN